MNKKAQIGVGGIVILVMGIIVCLVIAQQIFNDQSILTTKRIVIDEIINIAPARLENGTINESTAFTITNAPAGWKVTKCPISAVTFGNATVDYTLTTDYLFTASTGVLTLKNTNNVNGTTGDNINTTYIDYTWCPDGYNPDSGSRGIAAIIGLFAIIALVIWVLSEGRINDLF